MKTGCRNLISFVLLVVLLAAFLAVPAALSQTPPSLGLIFSAGQPTLNLTGDVGTVYSIQYAANLSPTNPWTDRTLVQAQNGGTVWSDPSALTNLARYYRAVSIAAPADTNLVFIQPGTFLMGSPSNEATRYSTEVQRLVTISRGFWMEKYLVTQGDYLAVVGTNPSYFSAANGYSNTLTLPVDYVAWKDATNYCHLRTQLELAGGLIPTNCAYRLPTVAEFEYACRAGTTTAFYLGNSLHGGQANFNGHYEYDSVLGTIQNANGIYIFMPTPVGSYPPNPWGLYDMIGNMLEWCLDWYSASPSGTAIDPQGPPFGSYRVIRGGSWLNWGTDCRSARFSPNSGAGSASISFRVVLSPTQ